ncbi:MAG: C39 family peptidase [Bacilli bacterium]|nr:C39 family peptidase [Bacilli bacterium]
MALIIELFFIIFGTYYIVRKKSLDNKTKNIIFIFYFLILLIFNMIFLKEVSLYCRLNINVDNVDNKKNEIKLYSNRVDELLSIINDSDNDKIKNELDLIALENSKLQDDISDLKDKKKNLEKILNNLISKYEDLEQKTSFMIKDFPTYHQFPNYPNGCESVSLYLMLKYQGVDVTVEEIVNILKKGDAPYRKNGVLYGADPEIEFVGDPRLKTGYGVFEKPILDVANHYKSGMKNITGSSLSEVLKIVSNGKPVQVWASINLKNTYICAKWKSTSTDRYVEWKCGLHSLVIIGYTYNKIITSDPYTGKVEYYTKNQFEKMYEIYGKRAIYYE